MLLWQRIGATLLCLLLAACGDDTSTPVEGTPTDTTLSPDLGSIDPTDATSEDAGADCGTSCEEADVDASSGPEVSEHDCPGQPGCACASNVDCDNGFCIDTPEGKHCATPCVDSCDDAGFVCKLINLGSSDKTAICVPVFMALCNPCKASAECTSLGLDDAVCVDQGADGAYCGAPCSAKGDCPADYSCADVKTVEGGSTKQCVRIADPGEPDKAGLCPCTKTAVTKKLSTRCEVAAKDPQSGGDVTCAGTRSCLPSGLSDCTAPPVTAEACDGADNDCDGVTDEAACDDDNPCTTDTCLPGSDGQACKYESLHAVPCDADGNACTTGDVCDTGVCKPGKAKNCDDGNPCTIDFCDMAKGCTQTADNGAPCDDENPCSIGDVCGSGTCKPGVAKACSSPDPCLLAKCDAKNGKCKLIDAPEGLPCNDGTLCTAKDVCKAGNCTGVVVDCDDKNPCTNEGCEAKAGCSSTANANPCDDGNKCSQSDSCKGGICAGLPVDVTVTCDDGNPCTTDLCKAATGCAHIAHKFACDDGNPCTKGDVCGAGKCVSGTNICGCAQDADCQMMEDGNLCNGTLFCDMGNVPYHCKVNPKTVVTCAKDKDSACIHNSCAPATAKCALKPINEGKGCDADGNVCTTADSCNAGTCVAGKKVPCHDGNPCTDDSCDAKAGCQHAINNAPCDADGDACTVADACKAKACLAGLAKVCDDGTICTKDACDKNSGECTVQPLNILCDDSDNCTMGDNCGADPKSGAHGCQPGKKKDCDDGNVCTQDACDAKKGCGHVVDVKVAQDCYSGPAKTKGVGICKAGKATCQSDGKAGPCLGAVLPANKEACDGLDDDCNGQTDEGCKAGGFRYALAPVQLQSSGAKWTLRGHGGRVVAGRAGGAKLNVHWSLTAWFKALWGGK